VAVASGSSRGGGRVAPRLGFGQREGDERPAGREVGKPALLLLVGAGEDQRQGAQLLDREDQPARRARPADLFHGQRDREQLAAEAAVLGWERQPEDVVTGQELLDVPRELGGLVDRGRARRDLLVGEDPDRVAEHQLLLGQAVRPGGGGGGRGLGHRGHRTSAGARCPSRIRSADATRCTGAPATRTLGRAANAGAGGSGSSR
jgi:hypothetical protein